MSDTIVDPSLATARRSLFHERLHRTWRPGAYDNWRLWAGALSVDIDGLRFEAALARAFLGDTPPQARARCEVFIADVDPDQLRPGDLHARLWTDALDGKAAGTGAWVAMRLRTGPQGAPELCGNNLVFESEPFELTRPGAFAYTVELSASPGPVPEWVALNDIADNRDGVIVVSPAWVAAAPSVTEVCLRKVGARIEDGVFHSGRIRELTARLEQIPTDIVYLLPFFRPGCGDLHTGQDVRKGELGSVYAVADFYQIDPDLVTPVEAADLPGLVAAGWITDDDVADVWRRVPGADGRPPAAAELDAAAADQGDRLTQLVGRAELRQLTGRAHELGRRVIFDLVLMQTSRDSDLVAEHPEWYVRDAAGRPEIHRIAWLVYSDVALFDLVFNRPLQDYLVEVAPYWMACCGLDGVRIDASQTVDRPFLKRLKNRIQAQDPEALVLGETLCALHEAVDVPVDMIYALLVDFHRDAERAAPLLDFLEQVHGTFAAGTVAMAYFENHDSPRATAIWRQRYAQGLATDAGRRRAWSRRAGDSGPPDLVMALAKNLQATLIDATAGMAPAPGPHAPPSQRPAPAGGTQLAWAIEWGSDWGEQTRTDFENPALLHTEQRDEPPRDRLVAACRQLARQLPEWTPARRGRVYYHRRADGDDDRVLAYTRHLEGEALVAVHNLDPWQRRTVRLPLDWLGWTPGAWTCLFDAWDALGLAPSPTPDLDLRHDTAVLNVTVDPLQSRLLRLTGAPPP